MKRISVILLAALLAAGLAGCASSGTSGGDEAVRYVVDLSTLTAVSIGAGDTIGAPTGETVRNKDAFTKNYEDLMILFSPFPADMDWSEYSRVTIMADCYNADGDIIAPGNGNAMVTLLYDPAQGIRGKSDGSEGATKNTPLKTYNLGGSSSSISRDRGYPVRFTEAPQAMLLQNSNTNVKFIQVTSVVFHNGSASGPASTVFTESNLGSFNLTLKDNFEYGDNWQAEYRPANMLNNYALQAGDIFELTIKYTASRDLSNSVAFSFVNVGTSWAKISTSGEVPASQEGEEVSATLTLNISAAGGGDAEGNTLVVQTPGTMNEGPVTLNFSQFVLKKTNQ